MAGHRRGHAGFLGGKPPVGRDLRRMHGRVRWQFQHFRAGPQSTAPLATFPQAPLRSRTAGFPQSGADLDFPSAFCPPRPKRFRLTPIRPGPPRLTRGARSCIKNTVAPAQRPGPVRNRPVPRVPSPAVGGTVGGERSTSPFSRHYPAVVATTNPCASPHPSRRPQFVSLVPPVFAGCGQPLRRCGPSRS